MARENSLDLVEVSPNSSPPVCRLLDYGKYRYEQSKKERETSKRTKTPLVREIRVSPRIGDHDLTSKVNLVKRLLAGGDKVKVTVFFRGREANHPERGKELVRNLLGQLEGVATVEKPVVEQRKLYLLFSPLKQSVDKIEKKVVVQEVTDAQN